MTRRLCNSACVFLFLFCSSLHFVYQSRTQPQSLRTYQSSQPPSYHSAFTPISLLFVATTVAVLAASARKAFAKANPARTSLLANIPLTADTHLLRLALPPGFSFSEGQSVGILHRDRQIHRVYSIASGANDRCIDLCVRRVPGGEVSNALCSLKAGEVVEIFGPLGKELCLPADFSPKSHLLLIATGTGIAPFRGILRKLHAEKFTGKIDLYLGVRTDQELLFKQELEFMASEMHGLKLHFVFSREGASKYVQDAILADLIDISEALAGNATIMVCGNKAMGKAVTATLEKIAGKAGFAQMKKSKRVKVEVY